MFLWKTILRVFKIALRLRDRHVFMWQSLEILNVCNNITLKQFFWKTKSFLKKLEHHFLVQSTTNENAKFPYETALSKANVKVACRVQIWRKKTFCQNSDKFGYSFIKNETMSMYILFIYKKTHYFKPT